MRDDHAGERRREHEEHQPRDAVFPDIHDARAGVGLIGRRDTGHLFDVFRGLLLHDVDDIVDRDDTDEAAFLIHDRDRDQVVVRDHVRDLFLVVGRRGIDDIRVHDVFEDHIVIRQQQILDRDDALELALGRRDIADVDRLLILADLADAGKCLTHTHVFFQIHELGRHDAASRVFRIFQVLVDEVARGGCRRAHDTLDNVGRQLLHHVDSVVDVQLFDNAGELRIGDGVDDRLLLLDLKIGKHGRRDLLGQDAEHHGHPLRIVLPQLTEKLGNIKLIHLAELLAQRLHPVLIQKCKEFVVQRLVIFVFPVLIVHLPAPPFRPVSKDQPLRYSFWLQLRLSMETPMALSLRRAMLSSISAGTDTTPGFSWPRVRTRYSALMACTAKLMSMISAGCPSPAARLTSRPCAMT